MVNGSLNLIKKAQNTVYLWCTVSVCVFPPIIRSQRPFFILLKSFNHFISICTQRHLTVKKCTLAVKSQTKLFFDDVNIMMLIDSTPLIPVSIDNENDSFDNIFHNRTIDLTKSLHFIQIIFMSIFTKHRNLPPCRTLWLFSVSNDQRSSSIF